MKGESSVQLLNTFSLNLYVIILTLCFFLTKQVTNTRVMFDFSSFSYKFTLCIITILNHKGKENFDNDQDFSLV